MTVANSPTLLAQRRMSRLVTQVRVDADAKRIEAVTGRVNSIRAEMKGQIGKVQLVQKAIIDSRKYRQSLDLANFRLTSVETAVNSITEITERVNRDMLSALNTNNKDTTQLVAQGARAAIGVVFETLNMQLEGRFIFSGSTIDTAPMGDMDTMLTDLQTIMTAGPDAATVLANFDDYFDNPAGGFQTTIYTGSDNNAPDIEVGPGVRVPLNTRADDDMFKSVIKGLALSALAGQSGAQNPIERELFEAGSDRMIQAQYDTVVLRANIGNALAEVGVAESTQAATEQALTLSYNDFVTVDQTEAASLMQYLDTQLEASYAATARLTDLTFLDYMR